MPINKNYNEISCLSAIYLIFEPNTLKEFNYSILYFHLDTALRGFINIAHIRIGRRALFDAYSGLFYIVLIQSNRQMPVFIHRYHEIWKNESRCSPLNTLIIIFL